MTINFSVTRALAAAALLACSPAFARDVTPTAAAAWPEIETENLFGFTEGTDIGAEGEKEFFVQTNGRFGKANGTYRAFNHKVGFGYTPSQFSISSSACSALRIRSAT